jgi:hypothetical protein
MDALHWEGFPRLLWESLRAFDYAEPPQYDAVEHQEDGIHRARVRMIIPQHPFRSQWQTIEVIVMGYRIVDMIEGVSEFDSEHGDPVISPHHSSSGSQSSVGNLDDF